LVEIESEKAQGAESSSGAFGSWVGEKTQGPSTSLGMTGVGTEVGLGRVWVGTDRLHRSFVGGPSLCDGLRFLRMTAGAVGSGWDGGVNGGGRQCLSYMFFVDFAL
jgi:hypothetical protein